MENMIIFIAAGAILLEWNVQQPSGVQAGAGMWDSHIRYVYIGVIIKLHWQRNYRRELDIRLGGSEEPVHVVECDMLILYFQVLERTSMDRCVHRAVRREYLLLVLPLSWVSIWPLHPRLTWRSILNSPGYSFVTFGLLILIYLHREPGSGWLITIWTAWTRSKYHFILVVVFYPNLRAQYGSLAQVRWLVGFFKSSDFFYANLNFWSLTPACTNIIFKNFNFFFLIISLWTKRNITPFISTTLSTQRTITWASFKPKRSVPSFLFSILLNLEGSDEELVILCSHTISRTLSHQRLSP